MNLLLRMKLAAILSSLFPLAAPFSCHRLTESLHAQTYKRIRSGGKTWWRGFNISARSPREGSAEAGEGAISRDVISDISVATPNNDKVLLGSLLPTNPDQTVILACLSHFGDFNAWEVTQQYVTAVEDGAFGSTCKIVLVGIGSADAARQFSADLSLESRPSAEITLVADEKGAVTDALNCYKGWLAIDKRHAEKWPASDVSPYIKLFGMIFGFGSPGTIEKVIYGYVGDSNGGKRSRKWVIDALLQGSEQGRWPKLTERAFEGIPEETGLRPFELATLRAQTGIHIVLNWGKLGPKNGDLFTRMGGTFVFRGEETIFSYFDKGILTYAPQDEVLAASNV